MRTPAAATRTEPKGTARRPASEVERLKVEILGSGGAIRTPRPGCSCRVCAEARQRGVPYARSGPGAFVHGPDLLVDTSEDIYLQLDRANLLPIRGGLYTHWHPDHTMGRRVWETLNADFRRLPTHHRRSNVYVPNGVLEDFVRFGLMPHFDFLARRFINLHVMEPGRPYEVNGYLVTAIPLAMERAYAFLFEGNGAGGRRKRVLVAMDELRGWSPPKSLAGLDLAVLPTGLFEFDPFTGERRISPEHPLLREEATFEQTLKCVAALGARRVVLTHIEEPDGLTYDDLVRLQGRDDMRALNAAFAYDGLIVGVAEEGF